MPSRFPHLTLFIDAAGRYSHSKAVPIVFAGIVVETKAVNEIRESLLTAAAGHLYKWSNGVETQKCASTVFRLIAKRRLLFVVRIVWKNTPEWDEYFLQGQRLYETGVRKEQRALSFAKPMAIFKVHQFGKVCGDLIGFFARKHRHRLPQKESPIQPIEVTAVFDSDIQGASNRQICKDVFANAVTQIKEIPRRLRIMPNIKPEIMTEQEEPLLILADYLAGYHYSRLAYDKEKEKNWVAVLSATTPMVKRLPLDCQYILDEPFREKYSIPSHAFDQI